MKVVGLIITILGAIALLFTIYMWVVGGQQSIPGVIGGVLLIAAGIFCLTRKTNSAAP